jgi:hypothetical protein
MPHTDTKPVKRRQQAVKQKLEYTEPLTGTLAEAADSEELGVPYAPLQDTWLVDVRTNAVDPSDVDNGTDIQ